MSKIRSNFPGANELIFIYLPAHATSLVAGSESMTAGSCLLYSVYLVSSYMYFIEHLLMGCILYLLLICAIIFNLHWLINYFCHDSICVDVIYIFSCDQAALRSRLSVRLSVLSFTPFSLCKFKFKFFIVSIPSHLFHYVSSSYHHEIFRCYYHWQKWCPWKRSEVKGHSHRGQNKFCPNLGVSRLQLQFKFTGGYKMMHKAWSSIEEVPYCFF